jgi:two-component system chemotaxis response regulator CheY
VTKTILTVDDSVSIRQMVTVTLQGAGFSVLEAVDGADGLEKAKSRPIHLVLTDQNMPRMDGISLVKALRGLPQYRVTPILMLTTESGDAMKAQGKAAGATGWLVKPFNPQRLLEVVNKVLGRAGL